MLTIHHLGKSQSERIVWLCEELAIPYKLKVYDRDAATMLAPADYKALHPIGAAPVITDGDLILAESEAIIDYIIARHGGGRLALSANDEAFPDYLYWYHFTNGTLQPSISRNMIIKWGGIDDASPISEAMRQRTDTALKMVDQRVADHPFLAGDGFTAADIMIVFSLTTMRYFISFELTPYPAILAYLKRISSRPAYQAAMAKGDPGMPLLLD